MNGGAVLAVDGGASKTIALVVARDGTVLGHGRAGNADIYQTPDAVAHVRSASTDALSRAGLAAEELAGAAFSLVGADWPEDISHWRASLPGLGLGHLQAERVTIVNDALGALAAGAPEGPAIAVVLGTGCAIGARGPEGEMWHSSFWQRTQGGGELAERALDAVYLADLGIAPPTALTARALAHFGMASVEDLLHAFTGRLTPPPKPLPGFAPHVLDAAAEGDAAALDLAERHADALIGYARAAARKVGIGPGDAPRIVLAGGVFRHPARLIPARLVAALSADLPGAEVVADVPEPVAGVAALALTAAGTAPGGAVAARLVATLPDHDVFHTGAPLPPQAEGLRPC
ncbi:BadF/BadG/BcrA/BcrD ATPase family protein [Pseudoroseicyclus tamaricis]|uniref:ATPase BadF/BadG/BcrA/BcrD type domain-containing protein n=1 Tax=Pseudoroseicyclus tamaricis TaxID=2705421 RepID=A0A6B2K0W4_9RHOB|nr:BadF/BadG/BcrA/BcrD ATPase family protein [Pseudoroseicyclus tamaricis]NDV01332.1 hypothetical protein [Pseudoroseicyclus tamaricis]